MRENNEHQIVKAGEILCQEISDPSELLKDPLVSVKMITYNHEPYIAQAIEGVLIQDTDFPIELVIGEDCSTDRTREIVLDYQKHYPKIIRLITSEKNVGAKENGYRTEQACRGKYIAFCEGDDYWHQPLKLQKQVDFLESNPDYGMVHSNAHLFWVKTDKLDKSAVRRSSNLKDDNAYFEILSGDRIIWTLTVCLRKHILFDVIEKNPECSDGRFLMGDTQRWLEMSRLTKIKYFPESLATRNALLESMSRTQDPKKALRFRLSGKQLFYHYLSKYECPGEIDLKCRYHLINSTLYYAYQAMDFKVATKELIELKKLGGKISLRNRVFYFGSRNRINHFIVAFFLRNLNKSRKIKRRIST